jgi:tRNA modification GTPase
MASAEVDGVLELVYAGSRSAARQAARLTRGTDRGRLEDISERLTELIALIEAGIDFVEEEDVQFITPAQVRERIDNLLGRIERFGKRTEPSGLRGRPHIALVGLPNAGKSTLFNALVGRERAIVAPVLGTTRDVLSAEVRIEGVDVVVQDCAGLGDSADDLDLAAHRLAEEAADRADLVLWVHDHRAPWAPSETACCERIEPDRRILVWSKADLAGGAVRRLRIEFAEGIRVSAATSEGLNDLRRAAIEWIGRAGAAAGGLLARELGSVAEALRRARGLVAQSGDRLEDSELLALDLRTAWERIDGVCRGPLVEEVLGKIFSRFCIGK